MKERTLLPKIYLLDLIRDLEKLLKFIKEKGRAAIMGSSLFFVFARDYY